MNMNQIINMVMRTVMRRVVNSGINAGMNVASNVGRKRQSSQQPAVDDYGQVKGPAKVSKSARQTVKVAKRLTRM